MAVSALQKCLEKYWYSTPGPLWALYPLELLYLLGARLQKLRSRSHAKNALPVPVLVIGNISVGGTGKTPTLISLIRYLHARGLKPGVVSRGFGRKSDDIVLVDDNTAWENCGDEPRLIYLETQCPVVVFSKRQKAAEYLLQKHPECNIILADDGLQHYQLARDFEIAIVDGQRVFGNSHLLPVGPLREKPARLRSVDWVLVNRSESKAPEILLDAQESLEQDKVFPIHLAPTSIQNIVDASKSQLANLAACDVALAGIGNPLHFFMEVRKAFPKVVTLAFGDHFAWTNKDLMAYSGKTLVTTAKDAVKIREVIQGNNIDASGWWQLNVEMKIPEAFTDKLYQAITHWKKP